MITTSRICTAVLALLLIAPLARGADAKPSLQQQAVDLFNSLTPEQRKEALLPYDSKERNSEVFPGGKRPGISSRRSMRSSAPPRSRC
jgi:hypothetical protein